MTAGPVIDHSAFLYEHLAQARPDLMRELLTTFINALLSAQADTVCGGFELRRRGWGSRGLNPGPTDYESAALTG